MDHLLNLTPLPQQLESHQAHLVVQVLEASIATCDHVILVISKLQSSVNTNCDGNTSLLCVLGQKIVTSNIHKI